jgi:hypothetical protein
MKMNRILTAAAIVVTLTIPQFAQAAAPKATCNIKTVSYKFTGAPGTAFAYDGAKYTVPTSGSIELIASKKATEAEFAGNHVSLDLFPIDEFGTRTIPLPLAQPAAPAASAASTASSATTAKGE